MKDKFKRLYMEMAESVSHLSSAKRLQVGAVVVKDNRVISFGYNGTPAGWDNNCELVDEDGSLTTKKEVIHAEMNAIAKLARSTESGEGATMFVTHAPCIECAKLIYQSGINRVFYKNKYRSRDGVELLMQCIQVEEYNNERI
jgi:dCMP deaminase